MRRSRLLWGVVLVAVLVTVAMSCRGNDTFQRPGGLGSGSVVEPAAATTPPVDVPDEAPVDPSEDLVDAERVKVDSITDGDTIRVFLNDGRSQPIRFIGIDSPETYAGPECGGAESTATMRSFLAPGDDVLLQIDRSQAEVDRYDRLLRYVVLPDGRDVGALQVAAGAATVYIYDAEFAKLAEYQKAEAAARDEPRGIWENC